MFAAKVPWHPDRATATAPSPAITAHREDDAMSVWIHLTLVSILFYLFLTHSSHIVVIDIPRSHLQDLYSPSVKVTGVIWWKYFKSTKRQNIEVWCLFTHTDVIVWSPLNILLVKQYTESRSTIVMKLNIRQHKDISWSTGRINMMALTTMPKALTCCVVWVDACSCSPEVHSNLRGRNVGMTRSSWALDLL